MKPGLQNYYDIVTTEMVVSWIPGEQAGNVSYTLHVRQQVADV